MEFLLNHGDEVLGIDIASPRQLAQIEHWQFVDVTISDDVAHWVSSFRPDVVFHLAARTDLGTPNLRGYDLRDYSASIQGAHNILRACSHLAGPPRVVLASTRLVRDIDTDGLEDALYVPRSGYAFSKVAVEQLVRSYPTVPWTIVRPTAIWGPWFGEPYRPFFESIKRGVFFQQRHPDPLRSIGYVGNTIAQLNSIAASDQAIGNTYFLADSPPVRLSAWVASIAGVYGKRVRRIPPGLLQVGGRLGDRAKKLGLTAFPLTSLRVRNLLSDAVYATDDLVELVGTDRYTLNEGVEATVAWLEGPFASGLG